MGNLERCVKGLDLFGDQPCSVNFFLLQHLDLHVTSIFAPVKERYGIDMLVRYYVKITGVQVMLQAADDYKNYKGGLKVMDPIKGKVLDAFKVGRCANVSFRLAHVQFAQTIR